MMDEGENADETAVRETFEEIGILFKKTDLMAPIEIPYNDKKGNTFKKVILFPVKIKSLEDIGLKTERVPLEQLQLAEIDDARFMSVEEFPERVMPRFIEPFTQLIEKYANS
jgi:8-oxo-dGTP pyrophosphatase MutT (NUDIX family)